MDQKDVIRSTATFLYDCIENNKDSSFAIIHHDESANIFAQFYASSDNNREVQAEVVGTIYAQPKCPEDHERFLLLLKNEWADDGNAQKFFGPLRDLSEFTEVIEKTISALINVYQLSDKSNWRLELSTEK
jgi:hypothetical protein